MSMWSTIKLSAPLTEEGRQVVAGLIERKWGPNEDSPWARTRFTEFAAMAGYIPFCELNHHVGDWKYTVDVTPDGVWRVCCSVNHGDDEIEAFVRTVLPHLIRSTATLLWAHEDVYDVVRRFDVDPSGTVIETYLEYQEPPKRKDWAPDAWLSRYARETLGW